MDMQNTSPIVSWFNEAPPDLQNEIFARLPVEFVYRYRLVCKQWNDLLSSNDFLSKWAEVSLSRKQPRLVLCYNTPETPWTAFCFYTRTWISSCFTLPFMNNWTGIPCSYNCNQSVPGLILVTRRDSLDGGVCNPYTKAFADISPPQFGYIAVDQINKSDASYRVVAVKNNWGVANGQMVHIYEPSSKRWNIAGYIPDDFIMYDFIMYEGSFYIHCHSIPDQKNGIGVFTIPNEGDGSAIAPNPIPILFAPFPQVVRNWMRNQDGGLSSRHIITCGSRVLLVVSKRYPVPVEQAGGEGEGKKQEFIIWEFITEGQDRYWVEIARMPSSMCEKWTKIDHYWMHYTGVGDYVCIIAASYRFESTEIDVVVATYNLIDKQWGWLPSLSTNQNDDLRGYITKAMAFVPNPQAKVE